MFVLNGKKLTPGMPFTIGEGEDAIQYPGNWLQLATPEERAALGIKERPDPVRPDERFYFVTENKDGSLTVTPKPREQVNEMVWGWIKAERDRRAVGGFPLAIDGVTKWFHSDTFSRTQHLGLKDKARDLLAAGGAMGDPITILGQPVMWKTMDGSEVLITAQLAHDLIEAAGVQEAKVFAAAKAHKAALEAAADPAAYDYMTSWPAIFEEQQQ